MVAARARALLCQVSLADLSHLLLGLFPDCFIILLP